MYGGGTTPWGTGDPEVVVTGETGTGGDAGGVKGGGNGGDGKG